MLPLIKGVNMIYQDILNSDFFKSTYSEIEEKKKDFPVNHGFIHIANVLGYAQELADIFALSYKEKELLLLACTLHDIGYLLNREQHPQIGADLAREYLQNKYNLNDKDIETICNAIKNHGGKLEYEFKDKVSLCLILADKLDFSTTRYSEDVEKYPQVLPFKNIIKITPRLLESTFYIDIKTLEKYDYTSVNYFTKLQAILNTFTKVTKLNTCINFISEN